ncbi:hypothetical protein, partial [Phascolarctobacterium sp.]|uniref:hypothetical protein n=1 Tax=Phascolarctobacterium sp. TaxID=2049039 RepID=UPI003F7ED5B7
ADNPGTNNCYIIHIKSSLFCEAKSEPLWARRGFSLLDTKKEQRNKAIPIALLPCSCLSVSY